ncbi:hypothetical protein T01_9436, partial [Trichinella spiralis]
VHQQRGRPERFRFRYIGIFPIRYQAISAKSERLTMRLEDAHGRMELYAVMELMTAVFNSPDAIPLNRC